MSTYRYGVLWTWCYNRGRGFIIVIIIRILGWWLLWAFFCWWCIFIWNQEEEQILEDEYKYSWSGGVYKYSVNTCKAEVFLPAVACGVVEFEHIQHSLRVFLLLRFRDIGGLQQPSPLLWHALREKNEKGRQTGMKIWKWARAHLIIWLIKLQQIKSAHYDRQETNGCRIQSMQLNWQFFPAFDGLGQIRGSMGKLHQRKVGKSSSNSQWTPPWQNRSPRVWCAQSLKGLKSLGAPYPCLFFFLQQKEWLRLDASGHWQNDRFQWTILQSMIRSLRWASVSKNAISNSVLLKGQLKECVEFNTSWALLSQFVVLITTENITKKAKIRVIVSH